MNCYLCLVETEHYDQPAVALCQRCGAGVCRRHLVERVVVPPVGMGNDTMLRYSLICCRCHTAATVPLQRLCSAHTTQEPETQRTRWNWWNWFTKRQQATLPEPEEAVSTVELFLKQQRKQ